MTKGLRAQQPSHDEVSNDQTTMEIAWMGLRVSGRNADNRGMAKLALRKSPEFRVLMWNRIRIARFKKESGRQLILSANGISESDFCMKLCESSGNRYSCN
jgi:hypothetical protein